MVTVTLTLLNCSGKKKKAGGKTPKRQREPPSKPSTRRKTSCRARKPSLLDLDHTQNATEGTVDRAMTGIEPDEDSFRHRVPRDISVKNAKEIRRQGMVPEDLTGAGTTEGMTTTNFDDTLA
ncbi:hypothetical protein AAVH_05440 [Aphelenchoides avenae]|nr:hypothetical protein AAVH_05440 [Aphelenchus avenae]